MSKSLPSPSLGANSGWGGGGGESLLDNQSLLVRLGGGEVLGGELRRSFKGFLENSRF